MFYLYVFGTNDQVSVYKNKLNSKTLDTSGSKKENKYKTELAKMPNTWPTPFLNFWW